MGVITFRADEAIEALLEEMANDDGTDKSTVLREAILLAAEERRRERIRRQCDAIRDDPEEQRQLREWLDFIEAPGPYEDVDVDSLDWSRVV